jgi:DNA-binding Lrp family transcriptional regulator
MAFPNPTDEDILNEIEENGRATVRLLADVLDKSRHYIQDRVERLQSHDMVIKVAPSVYDTPEQAENYLDDNLEVATAD